MYKCACRIDTEMIPKHRIITNRQVLYLQTARLVGIGSYSCCVFSISLVSVVLFISLSSTVIRNRCRGLVVVLELWTWTIATHCSAGCT